MKSPTRLVPSKSILIALGLALVALPAMHAADAPKLVQLADKAPILPLTAAFEKSADAQAGPHYVLKLTNTSKDSLTVAVKIALSVVSHASAKTKNLPTQVIAPGQTWTIPELASLDKVSIAAAGFAPLELTVP